MDELSDDEEGQRGGARGTHLAREDAPVQACRMCRSKMKAVQARGAVQTGARTGSLVVVVALAHPRRHASLHQDIRARFKAQDSCRRSRVRLVQLPPAQAASPLTRLSSFPTSPGLHFPPASLATAPGRASRARFARQSGSPSSRATGASPDVSSRSLSPRRRPPGLLTARPRSQAHRLRLGVPQ